MPKKIKVQVTKRFEVLVSFSEILVDKKGFIMRRRTLDSDHVCRDSKKDAKVLFETIKEKLRND